MPQAANKKWGEDSFDKDDYRCAGRPVEAGDKLLTATLNPGASEGGVHTSNDYPKPSGDYKTR